MVIIGVLSGPSVVNCWNASNGFGMCMQGKMADAGLLPQPVPAITETAPAASPSETAIAVTLERAANAAAPAVETVQPTTSEAAAEVPEGLVAASFGLLRAEPDGSVVIAGNGTPGTEVEVYANDELLGTATVEASGDWVLVPDEPLTPGGAEITLGEAGKEGRAEQSFVVAINDDKSSQPLVVASTPGAASRILQGLDTSTQPETTTQLVAAAPAVQPVPATSTAPAAVTPPAAETVAEAPAATTPSGEAPAPAAAPAEPAVQPAAPAPAPVVPPAASPVEQPAAPVIEAPAVATPPVATEPVTAPPASETAAPAEVTPPAGAETAVAIAAPAAIAPAQPANASPAVATETPAAATPVPPAAATEVVAPTIDAIEIDGAHTFFAGAGPNGATIRLYVDDVFVADTKVSEGRWLVEAGNVLTKPTQRIRIDMLQPGSAQVVARAEVDFVINMPENAPPTAVAEAPAPAPAPAAQPASAPAATPAPATPAPAAAAPATPPAAPPSAQPAVEQPKVPVMVAVAVGDPNAERFASGKAIIRRGDNLWTIARRVYGYGIRYTTIYQANTGQIRDPDRIYPGQVFDLPADTN